MSALKTILATATSFVSTLGLRPIWSTKNTQGQPATLGKQAEEILNDNFSILESALGSTSAEVARKADKSNFYNVSLANNKFDYAGKQNARNAVISTLRGLGQVLAYKTVDNWVLEQYIGNSVAGWGDENNWETLHEGSRAFTDLELFSMALKFASLPRTTWQDGALRDTGDVTADVKYKTSGFIDIEPTVIYNAASVRISMQYDEYKQPISDTYSLFDDTGIQFTARPEAKFVRFSVRRANTSGFKIVRGSVMSSNSLNNGLPVEVEPNLESVRANISGVINTYDMPPNILKGYDKLIQSRRIDIAGDVVVAPKNSVTTYFIEIKPDKLYSINFQNEVSDLSALMLFDENFVKILGTRRSVVDTNRSNRFITFTSPPTAKYIRISSDYDTWKYVYLCEGVLFKMDNNRSIPSWYTPDYNSVKKVIGQDLYTNKENILTMALFKYAGVVVGQNVTSSDSDWLSTDYIELDSSKSNMSHEYCRYVAYFDENKKFISSVDNPTRGFYSNCFFSGALSYFGSTPTRIRPRYIRVTVHISELAFARLWYGGQSTVLKTDASLNPVFITPDPQTPHFVDSLKNILNDKSVTYSSGTITDQGETIASSTDWMSTNLIDVSLLTNRHPYFKNVRIIAQYDQAMKFIVNGYKMIGDSTGTGSIDFDLLAETKYIRISVRKNLLYNAFVSDSPLINKVSTLRQGGVETYFNPDPDKVREIMQEFGVSPIDIREPKTGYTLFADSKDYRIWKPTGTPIQSLKYNWAIKYTRGSTSFQITTGGINGVYQTINLNSATFPNLLPESVIWFVLQLGFDPENDDPEVAGLNLEKGTRCCVITNRGQIFHNYPKKAAGLGTYLQFDESVVWDIHKRRIPSKTLNNDNYYLNPCLPDEAYLLTPGLNVDNGYGSGGFPIEKTMGGKKYNRFYLHSRSSPCIPFWFMGGFSQNHKLNVIGTYRANKANEPASRICLFASCDGGRQWHNIQEYASDDSENYGAFFNARGNKLQPNILTNNYTANSLHLQKVTLNLPSEVNKEPSTKFIFENAVTVSSFTFATNIVLTTSTPHGLEDGNRIVFRKALNWTASNLDFLLNDTMSENSGGNMLTWRVRVVSSTQIELYEYVHGADTNIPCRHIHAINASKNNFVVSCGEIYPQGWISMLMVDVSDSWYALGSLYDLPYIRLTSSDRAIQRSLGTLVMDNFDQTVIFASDDATIERDPLQLPVTRESENSFNSTGIYRGKLSDVDNINDFEVIYPAKQVAYLFQENASLWVFCGQQGELAISADSGSTWDTYYIGVTPLEHPGWRSNDGIVVYDGWLFYKK